MFTQDSACVAGRNRTAKLDALVRLLEDDSPVVREAVTFELATYGPDLDGDLQRLERQPDEAGWKLLGKITGADHRRRLRLAWPHWMNIPDDRLRLERALTLLAEFQNGPRCRPPLGTLLDLLADEYGNRPGEKTPETLAQFLFRERGLHGAGTGLFNADSSNLVHVIEAGRGLPVSLVCIYLLVGTRAGLAIHACNWPRHFLARYRDGADRLFIVDPANEGNVVDGETFLSMQGTSREAAEAVLSFEVDAATIITRILGNLVRAYRNENDAESCLLAVDLLRDMESRLSLGALC